MILLVHVNSFRSGRYGGESVGASPTLVRVWRCVRPALSASVGAGLPTAIPPGLDRWHEWSAASLRLSLKAMYASRPDVLMPDIPRPLKEHQTLWPTTPWHIDPLFASKPEVLPS